VVDDSAVVRQTLKAIIASDRAFQVLLANDPYGAVAVIAKTVPDVILLDVNMPRMDGITFLRKLQRQHPMPVIMCTDDPERGLKGLELGALEVIPKPRWEDDAELEAWGERLRESLRQAAGVRQAPGLEVRSSASPRHGADAILPRLPYASSVSTRDRIIAIGASTGGVQAVPRLLASLPAEMPGIVIVQHMPGGFTRAFAQRLDRDAEGIAVRVAEAGANEPLQPGMALIVPGTAHGVIRRHGSGYRVELADGPPVNWHRPSVDVLFRSVAQAAGPRAAGVLLTGMGGDGAQGLLEIQDSGGWTIAQDRGTCVVFGMPYEAIRRGAARQVLPLDQIGAALVSWCSAPPPHERHR
jgi:two-component system chemotaxis response regulator CheB